MENDPRNPGSWATVGSVEGSYGIQKGPWDRVCTGSSLGLEVQKAEAVGLEKEASGGFCSVSGATGQGWAWTARMSVLSKMEAKERTFRSPMMLLIS